MVLVVLLFEVVFLVVFLNIFKIIDWFIPSLKLYYKSLMQNCTDALVISKF